MKTTLILIRHGESEANREHVFAGQKDVKLLDQGVEQAKKAAKFIAENDNVDNVYSSDLQRAYQTGECIAELFGIDVIKNKNLREIYAGMWQGRKFSDIVSLYEKDYSCWLNDIGNCTCTGGESVKQLADRVLSALTEIAEQNSGKTVVVATHATPIRAMQCLWCGKRLDEMKSVPWVSNASITEVIYKDGTWHLTQIGKDTYLSELKTVFPENV